MTDGTASISGVYVSLDDLLALEHRGSKVSFKPRQPVHSLLSGRFASRMRGRGLNFEEIRDYRPGDDVRSIDWKVTARLQRPHVRVFNEERDRQTLLVVDQRLSMFFGSRRVDEIGRCRGGGGHQRLACPWRRRSRRRDCVQRS